MPGQWILKPVLTVAVGLLAMGSVTFATTTEADAAAPAKVMATTQLQSAATLNSTLLRWIPAGSTVSLECYVRGQSVKGYYSRWLPNGGWDNLWYRANGGYVADVDLNTGSNDPVTPACPPPASSSRAQRAVDWANQQAAARSMSYSFLCQAFVSDAYGVKGTDRPGSAMIAFNSLRARGMMHYTSTGIPTGALVFSTGLDPSNGHVMLSRGDGTFVSGGAWTGGGTHATVQIYRSPAPSGRFLGWSEAPPEWPGL